MSMTFPAFSGLNIPTTGQLLAETNYAASATPQVTSNVHTWNAFDTTNLGVAFTFPSSGAVDLEWGSLLAATVTGGGGNLGWVLNTGVNTLVGSARLAATSTTAAFVPSFRQRITGSAGFSVTAYLAGANSTAADGIKLVIGPQLTPSANTAGSTSPIQLRVYAA